MIGDYLLSLFCIAAQSYLQPRKTRDLHLFSTIIFRQWGASVAILACFGGFAKQNCHQHNC